MPPTASTKTANAMRRQSGGAAVLMKNRRSYRHPPVVRHPFDGGGENRRDQEVDPDLASHANGETLHLARIFAVDGELVGRADRALGFVEQVRGKARLRAGIRLVVGIGRWDGALYVAHEIVEAG